MHPNDCWPGWHATMSGNGGENVKKILWILGFIFSASIVQAAGLDHGTWDGLLKKHVVSLRDGHATQVNYRGMANDRAVLKRYLTALSMVEQPQFNAWTKPEQLAFLINAYNAWTVEYILTAYPNLDSIKDLGSFFQSPWKKRFIPLLGQTRSLDELEHGLIRAKGRYREPRIHFAVNCASIGCPALRPEAYTGARLAFQLEDATRLFLGDRRRNRLEGERIKISKIFKWYGQDFDLLSFFVTYRNALGLTDAAMLRVTTGKIEVTYLDYDWRLNAAP